jgi:hypothetical protein
MKSEEGYVIFSHLPSSLPLSACTFITVDKDTVCTVRQSVLHMVGLKFRNTYMVLNMCGRKVFTEKSVLH